MARQFSQLYEFGPFTLDVRERRLLQNGQPVPLKPKVLDTLILLVENRGHMLDKNELMRHLWPDSFVEEANLAVNISQLRKALGESENGQQYIETVPKRGYRFSAPVRGIVTEPAELIVREHTRSRIVIEEQGESLQHDVAGRTIDVDAIRASESESDLLRAPSHTPAITTTFNHRLSLRTTVVMVFPAIIVIAVAAVGFGLYEYIKAKHATSRQSLKITRMTATGKVTRAAISADGKYIAYVMADGGQESLWVRHVATNSSVQVIPPSAIGYDAPTFSPDGNYVYYVASKKDDESSKVYQMPVLGGASKKLIERVDTPITLSPDGQRLAFLRRRIDQEDALIIAKIDGSEEQTLVTRKDSEFFSMAGGPAWSPDGKVVACFAGNKDPGGLYLNLIEVRVEDGRQRPIAPHKWRQTGRIAWLRDGSGLLFTATDRPEEIYDQQLWHVSYPGGETRRVTNDLNGYSYIGLTAESDTVVAVQNTVLSSIWIAPNGDANQAKQITSGIFDGEKGVTWSSDGKIVYTSKAGGNSEVWIMDSAGSNQKQLTVDSSTNYAPSVSPDGRYIVFYSSRTGGLCLWRLDIDSGSLKQLTNSGDDFGPQCSPDGKWVLYTSGHGPKAAVWKVALDGGEPVRITDYYSAWPAISPDGKLIAYTFLDQQVQLQPRIAVMAFEGGQPVKVFDIPFMSRIHWTRDGRALTYDDGSSKIWTQPLAGGPPKLLTDFKSGKVWSFDWSPDGKQLAIARGSITSDVVLITNFR